MAPAIGGALLALAALLSGTAAQAQTAAAASAPAAAAPASGAAASAPVRAPLPPRDQYSAKGADTCLECHDDATARPTRLRRSSRPSMRFATTRTRRLDRAACSARPATAPERAMPAEQEPRRDQQLQVDARPDAEGTQPAVPELPPGRRADRLARQRARAQPTSRAAIATGVHQDHGDPVLAKTSQPDVCFTCHRQQRADFQKTSTHPVRFGLMSCSDCHGAHGPTQHRAARQADREPDLLQLPRREARAAAVGAPAGDRGLHACATRRTARCARRCSQVAAAVVPAVPLAGRVIPSFARTSQSLPGGGGGGSIYPRRGQLHQLPFAGSRHQPSSRSQADALSGRDEASLASDTTGTDAR